MEQRKQITKEFNSKYLHLHIKNIILKTVVRKKTFTRVKKLGCYGHMQICIFLICKHAL